MRRPIGSCGRNMAERQSAIIREVDPGAERAKLVRRTMGRAVRSVIDDHGDNIASFAIVAWDMRGNAHTSLGPDIGPIGEGLIPAYCWDVLNRHVTANLARDREPVLIPGEE